MRHPLYTIVESVDETAATQTVLELHRLHMSEEPFFSRRVTYITGELSSKVVHVVQYTVL